MSVSVKKVVDPVLLGEGPHWDDRQQALFFVSILEHTIHKYVPATGAHTRTKLDDDVGFIVPVEGTTDQFLIGLGLKFVIVQWDGEDGTPAKIVRELGAVDQGIVPNTRINDGKADPRGRVFAGTMGHEEPLGNILPDQGSLYRVDTTGIHKLCTNIGVSNGLAWDLKRKAFYYTDSMERKIRRYDYDVETGEIYSLQTYQSFATISPLRQTCVCPSLDGFIILLEKQDDHTSLCKIPRYTWIFCVLKFVCAQRVAVRISQLRVMMCGADVWRRH